MCQFKCQCQLLYFCNLFQFYVIDKILKKIFLIFFIIHIISLFFQSQKLFPFIILFLFFFFLFFFEFFFFFFFLQFNLSLFFLFLFLSFLFFLLHFFYSQKFLSLSFFFFSFLFFFYLLCFCFLFGFLLTHLLLRFIITLINFFSYSCLFFDNHKII